MIGSNRFRTILPSSIRRELRSRSLRTREGFRIHSSSFRRSTCGCKLKNPGGDEADYQVIEAYGKGLGEKKWKPIEAKLKEGRLIAAVVTKRADVQSG